MRHLPQPPLRGRPGGGLTEDLVELIDDDHADSALPYRFKLAARWADVLIGDPGAGSPDLRAELLEEFGADGVVELTATITAAIAFSKAAVAFGAPPDMPVIQVPTPTAGP